MLCLFACGFACLLCVGMLFVCVRVCTRVCALTIQVLWTEQQVVKKRKKRDVYEDLTDPDFPKQWYLVCRLPTIYLISLTLLLKC